jgi:phage protein D
MENGEPMTSPERRARRAEARVFFDGRDISLDMRRYLAALTYTDLAGGEADDLALEIDDRDGEWTRAWLGGAGNDVKGIKVSAMIIQKNWRGDGRDALLDCGLFELDRIDFSGPPRRLTLSATALPFSSEIRGEKKTRAWEGIKLSAIAREVAESAGLRLLWESGLDPYFIRCEQTDETGAAFLHRLCASRGLALKAASGGLAIYEEAAFEAAEPAITVKEGQTGLISWDFSTGMAEVYQRCRVSYQDPVSGKLVEGDFTAPGAGKDAKTLELREKASSSAEAKLIAKKRLREHNKGEFTASATLTGDVRVMAGLTARFEGFGLFDGKWMIDRAVHAIGGRGYTTEADMHRVLEGY